MRRICVFAGSSRGSRTSYRRAAANLGAALVERGLGLVYGGGCVGLMGVIAEAVLEKGGEVIGVIPTFLAKREVMHEGVEDMRVVSSMHERKALMAELGDAFVALPGGMGTLEELLETLTWAQLGLHRKPAGLLDVDGYYHHLGALLDHATSEGFVREAHRGMLLVDDDCGRLLDRFEAYEAPLVHKWIDRDET